MSPQPILNFIAKKLSTIDAFPGWSMLTPAMNVVPASEEIHARHQAQELAFQCLDATRQEIRPGWTEWQTAKFIYSWLKERGVHYYFHRPLVFFGERTKYAGFTSLKDLAPTDRVLRDNDVYILDFGPIVNGFACDVSATEVMGTVAGYQEANALLTNIRNDLPQLINRLGDGTAVWEEISKRIQFAGYDPIHRSSKYSFFGHRLNGTKGYPLAAWLASRGKQTYTEFFARGLAGQLWSGIRNDTLQGLWAVEPHIGAPTFGVKFEELLLVTDAGASWLRQ